MIKLLTEPHPFGIQLKRRIWVCVGVSGFVFLFLFIFRPFGLSELPQGILKITAGYGLTCFIAMALLNIVLVESFKPRFTEERWTLGKELIWVTLNIFFIGIANSLYSSWIFGWKFNLNNILVGEVFTLAVGVIPSGIIILLNHNRLRNKYVYQAGKISDEITRHERKQSVIENKQTLVIGSENKNEELSVSIQNLLFIRAADNYIEVIYNEQGAVKKQILRNTLRQAEAQMQVYPNILRCHKSYLVNLGNVKKISGNAQGYKLHIKGTDETVPVSRGLNDTIKQLLV